MFFFIVRLLREELGLLQQPGSYVGEVVKVMGSKRVLVKVHPEGKYGMGPTVSMSCMGNQAYLTCSCRCGGQCRCLQAQRRQTSNASL